MRVAIIDYGAGNLRSAENAFLRVADGFDSPPKIIVTADPDMVRQADRIMLPGVGAFAECKAGLDRVSGMVEALEERVFGAGAPFLGVCVGMQLMAREGREKVVTRGLGWIDGVVERLAPKDPKLKIPHMGWNRLDFARHHPVLNGIDDGPPGFHAYFVHSYHLALADPDQLVATTRYGGPVTACVARDTMFGTQFHPEKSQTLGLKLIENFLRWRP